MTKKEANQTQESIQHTVLTFACLDKACVTVARE